MKENETKTEELLNQVLAEIKTINENTKRASEKEEKKNKELKIAVPELFTLIFGVGLALIIQVAYDFYGSFFPDSPFFKFTGGFVIALILLFCLVIFAVVYERKHKK